MSPFERTPMRWSACLALAILVICPTTRSFAQDGGAPADEPKAETKPKGETKSSPGDLVVVVRGKDDPAADFLFRLGDTLTLKATGPVAAAVRVELAKPSATRSVILFMDGVSMAGMIPSALQGADGTEVLLTFRLARDAGNDQNRKAWDSFLDRQTAFDMKVPISLGLGNAISIGVGTPDKIQFQIANPAKINTVVILGGLLFILGFALIVRWQRINAIVKDPATGYYSLGKAQMAFWGLLIFLAVAGLYVVTGTLERIPPQSLILLGISGATGLSAVLIGRSKSREVGDEIKALADEQKQLEELRTTNPNQFPPSAAKRIETLQKEMDSYLAAPTPNGFLSDIMNDGDGPSLHRIQVVVWTLLLGGVFVHSLAQVMSMPEFPDGLLVLMGISNGTYLGFKIPEKP